MTHFDRHGRTWWTELLTRDVEGARDFYGSVCGWEIARTKTPEGEYYLCLLEDEPVAGIIDMATLPNLAGVAAHWLTFVAVSDLRAAIDGTIMSGGVVQRAPYEIPLVGRIAIVTDPGGAAIGLVAPAI